MLLNDFVVVSCMSLTIKKGGTAPCFSAILVPPSTIENEKHEQFTPIQDMNLRRLILCSYKFDEFVKERNKDKVQVCQYIMSSVMS